MIYSKALHNRDFKIRGLFLQEVVGMTGKSMQDNHYLAYAIIK